MPIIGNAFPLNSYHIIASIDNSTGNVRKSDVSSQIAKPLCTVNIETGQEINVPKKCGKKERALHKKQ